MYARIVSFSAADPGKRDATVQTMRETVVPMLRQFDGFAGYLGLYDGANARAKGILLWESEEAAEAAEAELVERRSKLAAGIGLTLGSVELYEAPVVELLQTASA